MEIIYIHVEFHTNKYIEYVGKMLYRYYLDGTGALLDL
jgi:hypothetical protein